MDDKTKIELVKEFSSIDTESIKNLTSQLGEHSQPFTDDDLKAMLSSSGTNLLVARDSENKKIIAMITINVYRIPYVKKAYLDDFVVDGEYRGKGIGSTLFEKALEIAKEQGAAYVDFTSNPKRIEGNKLYEKLGFKKRDTNVYRLTFNYEGL